MVAMDIDDVLPGDLDAVRRFYLERGQLTREQAQMFVQMQPTRELFNELLDIMMREAWKLEPVDERTVSHWSLLPDD